MPWTPPATGVKRTPTNFEAPLKTFVDGVETTANSAQTTANSAQTTAQAKYTKPVGGIPDSDRNLSGSVGYQTWNGTTWSARPAGVKYVEAFSDGTAGSTKSTSAPTPTGAVDGDRWWKALA